jgi:hypothetical protein
MSNKYYIIKTLNNNKKIYYYVILENKKREIIIKFGGLKEQCIRILIDKKVKIGLVEDLVYKKSCSIFENLNNMELLLKNALSFCIKYFPEVLIYRISDMSYIQCSNSQRISLADLYSVKYDKTWYEKYFNAVPVEEQKNDVKKAKELINEKLNNIIDLDINDFINRYYIGTRTLNINKNIDHIKIAYKKGIKVKDYLFYFFNNNLDCRLYILFFQIIFGYLLYGKYWEISKEVIVQYDINSEFYESSIINKHIDLENLYKKLNEINNNPLLSNKI